MNTFQSTKRLETILAKLAEGDDTARREIIEASNIRFRKLASGMMGNHLRVIEESADVFQKALMKLNTALKSIYPTNVRQLHGLVATQIRRVLIDLNDKLQTQSRHVAVESIEPVAKDDSPKNLMEWADFHRKVQDLPTDEREVFGLLFYQDLTQEEAAEVLEVSPRTVKRRFTAAKLRLQKLREYLPQV